MTQSRQLAAIMFTDIVGYTALMGDDEQKAFELLNKNRVIHQPIIEMYNGKLIKELGDGILASFPTISEALSAAIKIQHACSVSKELSLRIGIHEGEIISENNDIYGDAVNIASRIQTLGIPGSILFSKKVADEIKNKAEFHTASLGSFAFKNVHEPIEVFALANEGFPIPKRSMMDGKLKKKNVRKRNVIAAFSIVLFVVAAFFIYENFFNYPKFTGKEKSIAVLPFINMSSDKENEYFSDGMTEEITTQLSKITDLKVIARTSAMMYKGSKKSIKEIAEELHVAAILEGSVQKTGNEIKITAQLIDANTQEHIWADKYEKDLKDIFSIQNEVAGHIAVALQTKLFKTLEKQVVKKETESLEAYNLYLKGRYYLNNGSENDLKKSIEYFRQAIEKDTGYARAYAALADAYLMQGEFEYIPGIEAWPKAEEFARKALSIEETQADAHNSLGHLSIHRFNWSTAEQELKRAIELNPGYADAHHFFSQYLSNIGLMDSSIAEALRSQALDPLSLLVSSTVGLQYYRARRWKEAEAQFKQTLEMHPDYLRARRNLGRVYLAKGMNREAILELEKSVALANNNPVALGYLGNAYGLNGEKDKAFNILDKLRKMADKKYISGEIAIVYVGLGDKDKAFEWLNKACDELSTILLQIKVDWVYDPIRSDPRFSLLLKKMGLE